MDVPSNIYRPIFVRGATEANDIEVYVQANTKDLIVVHNRGNGGTIDYVGFDDPPLGTPFHLAVTFNGAIVQAYYDGTAAGVIQQTTDMTAPLDTNMAWWIGKVDHSAFGSLGSGNLHYFKGTIDEVRIWDIAAPSFNLNVDPKLDFNPVGTDHIVTATVTIDKVVSGTEPAPGVLVEFDVSGANIFVIDDYTDSEGVATFTYTSSEAGEDIIMAGINEAPYAQVPDQVTKYWLENFVTGGGNIKGGKKVAWTFAGTVGNLEDDSVGQFQIVDHTSKIAYHCNNNFSYLVFSGGTAESPFASNDTATFTGNFTNNRDANTVDITVIIQDLGEPGAGTDKIEISGGISVSPIIISGGNFQVHDL